MRLLQTAEPLPDRLVIDASAGTGKTWSVVALIARELALREDLRIGNLLITTFTRNAAAELRDRLRKRLASSAQGLKSDGTGDLDPLNSMLRNATDAERLNRAQRLERALTEFDSASISTIHGICSRILRAAGREIGSIAEASTTDRITSEVINDLLVTHAASAGRWDEKRLRLVVAQLLGDPYLQPWFDANDSELKEQDRVALTGLIELLGTAVSRIQAAMRDTPDYNDVLRLAWQLVRDPAQAAVLAILKQRFRLAIVDEAQDTNRIQWELFEQLFPGGDGRSLVSVGDPKQAIYGFRGADVQAYVEFTGTTTFRYSLDVNRRSDQPLLTQLNDVMANHEFGTGIQYVSVHAPAERQTSLIEGTAAPLEFIGVEGGSNQTKLIRPAVGKVQQLLEWGRILPIGVSEHAGAQNSRAVEPSDICILVRSNGVGRLLQRGLSRVGIPSVTGGTSSVMRSGMALEIRTLLEAMERPASTGRVRRVAATVFFGHPMASVGVLTDEQIEAIQSRLMHYSGVLTKKGLAALSTTIESDESVMMRMVAGKQGERNLTDFMHLLEVMDSHSPVRGCTAEKALQIYGQLDELDDKDELVSRRVESDADAVRILTIHAAKGLQFPCVLVADLWKGTRDRGKTIVFYDRDGGRKIDIGTAVRTADGYAGSEYAKECWLAAQDEELKRLIYVAATRAEHWLGVLVPTVDGQSLDDSILAQTMTLPGSPAELGVVPDPTTRTFVLGERAPDGLRTADLSTVQETWRKQSFTGITAAFRGGRYEPLQENGSGHDEVTLKPEDDFSENPGQGGSSEVIDLPAGTAVGTVVHEIFEHVDTSRRPLRDEVARVVNERVTGGRLRGFQDRLISCITDSLETPLGAHLGELTLAEIGLADRLSELRFDMSLMSLADGICACDLGSKLIVCLKPEDSLFAYAETLARPEFNVPLGGLLNGSIDAVLRLPGSSPLSPRLLIVDYKSNKLHQAEDRNPLAAYAPGKLATAMAKSHYPLQALLYGVALYRFLRWRAPEVDPDQALAGFVYGFIRGMRGPNTPSDNFGNRYGVFAWQAPAGLWSELSQFLASPVLAGANR